MDGVMSPASSAGEEAGSHGSKQRADYKFFEGEQKVYSIFRARQDTQTIFAAIAGNGRRRHGTSLVEVMLAVLILVIAVIGVSTTYVSGRRELAKQRHYQAAAQLAAQSIEELKATGYAGIGEGEEEEEFTINDLTYVRNTQTELTATPSTEVPKPCKKVTVTITWSLAEGSQHQARLVTYIGP
jgi:Tfp pilus assembly protein PilV